MARLKALVGFLLVTASVFLVLRAVHLGVPVFFPGTRQGPLVVERLEDVERQVGFAPIVPAYRPAVLGDHPGDMTIQLSPVPTFRITWRGAAHDLTLTQRRGGADPDLPPLAHSLDGVPGARWWIAGGRSHLLIRRDDCWIELDTSLPVQELRRFADTLTMF